MPSITITATAQQAIRAGAALGIAQNLMDNAEPPQPRSATVEEIQQFLIQRLRQLVVDVEGNAANVARGPVVVPAFDPT